MYFSDNLVAPKLCGIFILSFISIIIGLLPLAVHLFYQRKPTANQSCGRRIKYKRLLAHMSAFGGGVLLSTTFLHLLPEIRKSIEIMKLKNGFSYKESLPMAELLMCLGFLFLYFIEEVAHSIMSARNNAEVEQVCVEVFMSNAYDSSPEISTNIQETNSDQQCRRNRVCDKSVLESKHDNGDRTLNVATGNEGDRLSRHNDSIMFFTESSGRNFLLIFALSIHEGFEGLAIGLERQFDAVWYMIIGVGSHKAVIAFCIGVQMLSSKLELKLAVIYIFMFSTATSLGVAIGMCLSLESGIFSVILQGLATGTLLHVVFFELLKPHSGHTPFIGVFLGFVCMAILKYFSP